MIVKEGILMHNSCSSCHDHLEEMEEDEESRPQLSYVHPKLPDYDELVATFTEYKKDYVKSNSSNRTFWNHLGCKEVETSVNLKQLHMRVVKSIARNVNAISHSSELSKSICDVKPGIRYIGARYYVGIA
ncbi:hypothetical protein LOK49_LG12G02838 [Camellia lanceoleosa]|uniref:Uncharacterized protein n=1 Tax=Camellia lanceoleosa TaxID=1840588 RepID=A0ACC0FQY8_9ERIC|nr:hypothetical protein LOK49_LG12G02838 [Camellia lanceoleosa]